MSEPNEPKEVGRKRRDAVRTRAKGVCEYCRSLETFSISGFSIEHIIPRAVGGTNAVENLALACQECNAHKFIATEAVDLLTSKQAALYHPRHDVWADHFAWADDYTVIMGRTPTGRATVERLQINRSAVVNLRRILRQAGYHPPQDP